MQDVADAHAVRVKADDHVVQAAGDPPGPLGHQQRLKHSCPVPGHLDRHRPDPGLHLLADRAIARIAGIMAGRVMPGIAQVRGQLSLQRPLQHRLDQLAQHAALTGQPQPPGLVPGTLQQRIQQPVIDQLTQRSQPLPGRGGFFPAVRSSLPRNRAGFTTVHQPGRARLLACNGHDRCSPPVTVAIPTSHAVPFDHSLHTWRDTPWPRPPNARAALTRISAQELGHRSGELVADGASAPPGDGGGGGEVCFAEDG
jgi:hypothetical protein